MRARQFHIADWSLGYSTWRIRQTESSVSEASHWCCAYPGVDDSPLSSSGVVGSPLLPPASESFCLLDSDALFRQACFRLGKHAPWIWQRPVAVSRSASLGVHGHLDAFEACFAQLRAEFVRLVPIFGLDLIMFIGSILECARTHGLEGIPMGLPEAFRGRPSAPSGGFPSL